jgi:type I restriction enzyme S subunit
LVVRWWVTRPEYERFITGTTIKHIPKEKLRLLPVPLPPSEEQARIVTEVERQLSFVDACERAVDAGLARSAALRRSVLKAAFEGRLVPQDPSDEPASVLLERIRAERAAAPGQQGKRRKKAEAS